MNWNKGLKRISAAFFGFVSLATIGIIISLLTDSGSKWWAMLLGFPIYYGCHKVVCWIIDGFFVNTFDQ